MNKEDLNNKCIKYSSDITEEIFNKIIKKIESLGFTAFGIDCNYEGFKKYGYLRFSEIDCYQTACNSIYDSLTTVDYILENEYKAWYDNLKAGDYVVCIDGSYNSDIKQNYIYKFIQWQTKLKDCIICKWTEKNSFSGPYIDRFRPATLEEIKMYEHAGKPVDVTTYKLPKETTTTCEVNFEVGDIVRFNVEKAKPLCLVTSVWAKDFILEVHKVTEISLVFTKESMLKAGAIDPASTCSNDKRCFDLIQKKSQKSEFIHVNNLEINKVYKCSYRNDGNYIFWKYLGKDSNERENYYWIKTTPYLKPEEKYLSVSGGVSNENYTDCIKEVTSEESAWYERCLKEEKYISFEDFKKMKEEFVLPEKWCIVKNKKEICDWFNKSEGRTSTFSLSSRNDCYIHFPPVNKLNIHNNIQDGYTEITFEQFKQYVLKESFEEEITNLSKYVGRYIKALVDNPNGGSVKAGDIGLIISLSEIDFPSHKGYHHSMALDKKNKDKYELMPEDYKPESKLKKKEETSLNGYSVGDWCYIFNPGTSRLTKGNIYQINQIESKNLTQKYHFDDGSGKKNNACWVYEKDFRKATLEEIAKIKNIDSKEYFGYKIGDKVIINKRPSMWASALCSKDIRNEVSYPFIAEIQNLKDAEGYIAAKIGDGGWDLSTIVQENCIEKYIEPSIKDKFEVGKWYIYRDCSMLGCYRGNDKAYGLKTNLTKWSDTLSMTDNNWKPATIEQVEDALLKYAKDTYPIGCIVNSLGGFKGEKVNSIEKGKDSIRFITYNNNRGILFKSTNGKWAEIVTTPEVKKDSMQEILEEAKRRFPIGCKYYPVHENGEHSNTFQTQRKECYIYDGNWILGSYNVRNPQGTWAKLYEEPIKTGRGILDALTEPEKPKFEYKFKVGDKVLAVNYGSGISYYEVENYPDRVYTITELGKYVDKPGYKISPAVGNILLGDYNGFIGEDTFKLCDEESILVEWINTAQEIYKSKGEDALADYIDRKTDYWLYKKLPGVHPKEKAELFVMEYCSLEPIEKYPLTPREFSESLVKLKKFEIKKL